MPTPVGPAPRDPNDPDNWDWYEAEDDDLGPGFGWPLRLVALIIVIAVVALFVLAG
ncbi:MAG TPA: hypothetical protein VGV86_12015 [Acidimicrobiales bacterium]|nr:hypothetical protein [Acidimicrobiales bacterium]